MIKAEDVFKAFQPYRDNAIVSVGGTAGRHWRDVSTNEKRDVSLGGAMLGSVKIRWYFDTPHAAQVLEAESRRT